MKAMCLAVAVLSLVLASCSGPQGPQGQAGPQGQKEPQDHRDLQDPQARRDQKATRDAKVLPVQPVHLFQRYV
jgi:hypothetical protein